MRLTTVGRLLFAAIALANVYILVVSIGRAEWLGAVLSAVLAGIFSVPAIRGRDAMTKLPVPRWLGTVESNDDTTTSPASR